MESASYVWNLISNNALLATLVATACVGVFPPFTNL